MGPLEHRIYLQTENGFVEIFLYLETRVKFSDRPTKIEMREIAGLEGFGAASSFGVKNVLFRVNFVRSFQACC